MATVFWDTQGIILVDFSSRGETVNSDSYMDTLKRLWARILRVRLDMDIGNVILLHDNARPRKSIRTRETIASFGCLLYYIRRTRLIWLPLTITFSAP
ncbi:transposase [Elysia marginata]|uniref:Transposase n=1 Tax=Elysia marginata TaxID=1093978 RepID=A0AAV4ITK7_9GAST|nr:transposase [Elysia marginata]